MDDRTTFFNAMMAMGATPFVISATFCDDPDTLGWGDDDGLWNYIQHDMAEYGHTLEQVIVFVGRQFDNCDVPGAFGMWAGDHLEFSAGSVYEPTLEDLTDIDLPLIASIVGAQAELVLQADPDALGGAREVLAALDLAATPDVRALIDGIKAAPEWTALTLANRLEIQAAIVRTFFERASTPEEEPQG